MLKPIVLHEQNPRKKAKGTGYQARRKKNRKFVKKLVLEKMSNNMSHQNSNEIIAY